MASDERVDEGTPERRSVVVPLVGVVDGEQTSTLCSLVRSLLGAEGVDVVTCDARRAAVDLGLVDAIARLQLTALQLGAGIRVRGAGEELCLLIDLVGLADHLPVDPDLTGSGGEGR